MDSACASLQCQVCPTLGFPIELEGGLCGLYGKPVTFKDRVVVLRTDTSACVHFPCYETIHDLIKPLKDKVASLVPQARADNEIHSVIDHAYMIAFRAIRKNIPEGQTIGAFAKESPLRFNELVREVAMKALEAFCKPCK